MSIQLIIPLLSASTHRMVQTAHKVTQYPGTTLLKGALRVICVISALHLQF